MVPPLLKLAFVQGPRDGESLEYKPGSTIRIGRIVRGNEIVVKDAGVSTKHLRIVSDSENWIVHDLGSSNGTILNSEPLDSDTPVILRHGDVEEEEHKLPPRPRRNNRRLRRVGRPRKNEKKVAVMKEEEEADTRIGVEISEMKRGTRSKNVKCEDTVIEEKRRPSRATRSKKEAIGGDSFLELEMVLNQAKKSRAKKKKTEQKSVTGLNT
ncbi:BnaA05g33570D [Brassica napus]|uniref:BnaA05g33570D protein n=1 Tax=Brassica napus TaxID=3708 RepID=A0A078J252_BRANA|nr:BnaA05g33570D [Brassica napus]